MVEINKRNWSSAARFEFPGIRGGMGQIEPGGRQQ